MKAVRGHLVIDDGDTSAAIVSLLGTMPAPDQATLLSRLRPKTPRLRWLEPQAAARVVAALEDLELDPESRVLIENRLVPLWMRRARRQTERDEAIRGAAPLYPEHST